MAISLVFGILYLIAKLLAHALIFGGASKAAGTVSTGALKPILDSFNDLLVFIKSDLHINHRTRK